MPTPASTGSWSCRGAAVARPRPSSSGWHSRSCADASAGPARDRRGRRTRPPPAPALSVLTPPPFRYEPTSRQLAALDALVIRAAEAGFEGSAKGGDGDIRL